MKMQSSCTQFLLVHFLEATLHTPSIRLFHAFISCSSSVANHSSFHLIPLLLGLLLETTSSSSSPSWSQSICWSVTWLLLQPTVFFPKTIIHQQSEMVLLHLFSKLGWESLRRKQIPFNAIFITEICKHSRLSLIYYSATIIISSSTSSLQIPHRDVHNQFISL